MKNKVAKFFTGHIIPSFVASIILTVIFFVVGFAEKNFLPKISVGETWEIGGKSSEEKLKDILEGK